ncbi:protein-export chaperone SecB [Leptospira sp. WS58.C1]|uniref:protein-export chaperone SecB n=1 Tax=Leptospira TaxID=171 RepID=UPI0002BEAE3A|nr:MULTISPECIES: protein-export chaperone SecB [unclassified Leptospira]EMJ97528.1 preprotein translocase, SecB subunit-like protein [Leptospira sp. B5-022]MCR1792947.1 protein-export chaperone SecB [Leptospira sp. id769339]
MSQPNIETKEIQLRNIVLTVCEFSRTPVLPEGESIAYEPIISDEINNDKTVLAKHLGILVSSKNESLRCFVEYVAVYDLKESDKMDLEKFIKYNSIVPILPYVRETIQSLLQKGGVHAPPLPLFNVFELVDSLEKKTGMEK